MWAHIRNKFNSSGAKCAGGADPARGRCCTVATAVEFVPDMSPHDILRTVLGDKRSNDEIEAALELLPNGVTGRTCSIVIDLPTKTRPSSCCFEIASDYDLTTHVCK
jgi:hypothetical protein